jgi:hypothetical protein
MVDDRLRDGKRIAELLASELDGLGDDLTHVAITDADSSVTPTPDGAHAYRVTLRGEDDDTTRDGDEPAQRAGDRDLAVVFVQPDRARVEFLVTPDVAADAGRQGELRVRPKAVRPPRTLVFVEDGAEVKRAVTVFEAVVAGLTAEK